MYLLKQFRCVPMLDNLVIKIIQLLQEVSKIINRVFKGIVGIFYLTGFFACGQVFYDEFQIFALIA